MEFGDEDFDNNQFWIHIIGLLRGCYTKEVGRKFANIFNKCEEIQIWEQFEEKGARFFHIQAIVDVSKPVRHTVKIIASVHGSVMGMLRYERLPFLCYYCEHIGHTLKQCPRNNAELSEEAKQSM